MKFFRLHTFLFSLIFVSSSCSYRMGYEKKSLPGQTQRVYIPIFKNDSSESSLGMVFTNAFISEIRKSKSITISQDPDHETQLTGQVLSVFSSQINTDRRDIGSGFKSTGLRFLPEGAVLTTEYNIKIKVEIKLTKNNQVLYRNISDDEIIYSAPRLSIETLNSSNPNYNDEARRQSLSDLAQKMSKEIYLKMTEAF